MAFLFSSLIGWFFCYKWKVKLHFCHLHFVTIWFQFIFAVQAVRQKFKVLCSKCGKGASGTLDSFCCWNGWENEGYWLPFATSAVISSHTRFLCKGATTLSPRLLTSRQSSFTTSNPWGVLTYEPEKEVLASGTPCGAATLEWCLNLKNCCFRMVSCCQVKFSLLSARKF